MTSQYSVKYVRDFLARQTHMTIAVVCPDGSPWAVPVHIKHWQDYELEWESDTNTVHSRAIEADPRIAISMYQFTYGNQKEFGFYAQAAAQKVQDLPGGRARYRATMIALWGNGEDHTKKEVDILREDLL